MTGLLLFSYFEYCIPSFIRKSISLIPRVLIILTEGPTIYQCVEQYPFREKTYLQMFL